MPGFWNRAGFDPNTLEMKAEQSHASKCVILLCKNLGLGLAAAEIRDGGFAWFHRNFPSFPVHMESTREKLEVLDFWNKPTNTKVWDIFFTLSEELKAPALGLMVPIHKVKMGVLHTGWTLPGVPGHTRMERVSAKSETRGLILDTLPGFCASALKVWRP